MSSIFVSYRRADAPAHAGRIYEHLVERFGEANVYRDLDSTAPGADFGEVIIDTIATCDALVAVIGRDWLHETGRWRRRSRLEQPEDWVRREIAVALERNVRVVPVLVEGAQMPTADELPADIQTLARRHAVELSEAAWTPQLTRLIDSLATPLQLTTPTSDASVFAPGRSRWRRRRRRASRRLRAAAVACVACGLTIAATFIVLDRGDTSDHRLGSGDKRASAPGALNPSEYRLQVTSICTEHIREAERIEHAEGDRPLFGVTFQLEQRTTDKLKALRPPVTLASDHRAVLALWGRRLSLLGYYYDRYRREFGDPKFRREFARQLRRLDALSEKLQKRLAALGVTPECNIFT